MARLRVVWRDGYWEVRHSTGSVAKFDSSTAAYEFKHANERRPHTRSVLRKLRKAL